MPRGFGDVVLLALVAGDDVGEGLPLVVGVAGPAEGETDDPGEGDCPDACGRSEPLPEVSTRLPLSSTAEMPSSAV
jgi:hypothetical protein